MSLIKPGCDTRHIIQQAMNSKSLATLAEESSTYEARKGEPIDVKSELEGCQRPIRALYSKSDLENFRYICKGKTPDEIFEKLGIRVEYNKDGSKSISHYCWPFGGYCFKAAGIDEEKLLEGVTEIKGRCDLKGSELKNLAEVKKIGGNINIPLFTKIEDLSSIEYIGGDICCDAEDNADVLKLMKKIKLTPQTVRGSINPAISEILSRPYLVCSKSQDMNSALNALQARILYESNQPKE